MGLEYLVGRAGICTITKLVTFLVTGIACNWNSRALVAGYRYGLYIYEYVTLLDLRLICAYAYKTGTLGISVYRVRRRTSRESARVSLCCTLGGVAVL